MNHKMDQDLFLDFVTQAKQFNSYKVISSGKFSATIEVDYLDKDKKRAAVLVMRKKELEYKRFDWAKLKSYHVVRPIQHEYLPRLQTYLFYTEVGECTLEDKIKDKQFRKTAGAVQFILQWCKEACRGIKHIHSNNYVHLNISTKSVIITSVNIAKVAALDYCRSSVLEDKSFTTGLKSFLRAPESFAGKAITTLDGMKFDCWSLSMMTFEAVTNNYTRRKVKEVTSWPKEVYPVMHKGLQVKKFQKIVKEGYAKAPKTDELNKILYFIKHGLKFQPKDRPDASEIFLLLFELEFLKNINTKMTGEKIWEEKVHVEDLEHEIQSMAFQKKSSVADKETKYSVIGFDDEIVVDERTTPVKMLQVETKSSEGMMGDLKPDESDDKWKETNPLTFEHRDLSHSEISSQRVVRSVNQKSENVSIVGLDPWITVDGKHHSTEKTAQDIVLSRYKITLPHQSDNFVSGLDPNDIYSAKREKDETKMSLDKNTQQKANENIFTVKGLFCKMAMWALDETLYAGVLHHGSFINQLSKSLTS